MTVIPQIPSGRHRLTFTEPQFTHWDRAWSIIGPDTTVVPGNTITLTTSKTHSRVQILLGPILAERTVHHRPDSHLGHTLGRETRYVIAAIETATPAPQETNQ